MGAQRVKESLAVLECRLHLILPMGDSTLVFGEVRHAAVSDAVLDGGHPRIEQLEPLSRLGLDEWGTLGDIHDLKRIRLRDWPGDFRPQA